MGIRVKPNDTNFEVHIDIENDGVGTKMNFADKQQLILIREYTLKKINAKIKRLEEMVIHVEDKFWKYDLKMNIKRLKRERKNFTGEILE